MCALPQAPPGTLCGRFISRGPPGESGRGPLARAVEGVPKIKGPGALPVVLLVLTALGAALGGCIGPTPPPPDAPLRYTYSLTIATNSSLPYTAIAPAVIDFGGNVSEIMTRLPETVPGARAVALLDTDYGWGVKVEGTGNVTINISVEATWDSRLHRVAWTRFPNGDLDFDMWAENATGGFRELGFAWTYVDLGGANRSLSLNSVLGYPNTATHEVTRICASCNNTWQEARVILGSPPPPPIF